MTFRPARAGLVACLLASASACAETTLDPAATRVSVAGTTTTTRFAPAGTTDALLDQLVAETGGLSDLIVDNEGQRDSLARVETVWAELQDRVSAERPDLLPGFESAIGLVRTGVERRRPADADKAHNNLRALAAAYTSG